MLHENVFMIAHPASLNASVRALASSLMLLQKKAVTQRQMQHQVHSHSATLLGLFSCFFPLKVMDKSKCIKSARSRCMTVHEMSALKAKQAPPVRL